jgi:Uma2 family endonuclease
MNGATARQIDLVTAEAFLQQYEGARAELIDGEVRAMSPGSTTHARLQARFGLLIGNHLEAKKSKCWVGTEPAIRPRAGARHNIRVPDLGVTCVADRPTEAVMADPILLIEILSPGNTKDTRDNVWAYTTIPSVQEILVVHSTVVRAELLRRADNGDWPEDPDIIEAGGTIVLASIGATFAIADAYAGTHLA